MSAHRNRTRLGVEQLDDRVMPSAMSGNLLAPVSPAAGSPLATAHFSASHQKAVHIKLSAHITSNGSGVLRLTGNGSHLGRWSGRGVIDNVVIDPAADRVEISVSARIIAANGDRLFLSVSVSLSLTTRLGEETGTFTGGTGRFAGASGNVSLVCHTNWDPASPLTFECNGQGSGTLVMAHR
jgi:hypothetical protein